MQSLISPVDYEFTMQCHQVACIELPYVSFIRYFSVDQINRFIEIEEKFYFWNQTFIDKRKNSEKYVQTNWQ